MGTTLSALLLLQRQAWIGQAGDSRVYRLREGSLTQLTRDHTFVEESIRYGTMTREEAETHPHRHVLTRAVGAEDLLVPEIEVHDLNAGDRFLICSDGLTNHVKEEQIQDGLGRLGPSECAWFLVGLALQDGGTDNTTCLTVYVDELTETEA
jgi:serine/threonine protein phosphatase PrpC